MKIKIIPLPNKYPRNPCTAHKRHRDTIVEYLAVSPDVRNADYTLNVFARPFLDNLQFDKGSKELDRLTSNFPYVLEVECAE